MYDTLVHGKDYGTPEAEAHEAAYGRGNDAPPGFREITAEEFASGLFFVYGFEKVEYRQIKPEFVGPDEKYYLGIKLFYFHDGTGVGMAASQDLGSRTGVRYFVFGCAHKYRSIGQTECRERDIPHFGRCWHVNECLECGHIDAYDTSD